ncbi:acyltransferase [Konateibacter massiliensis]|uniref:acyltransferase n=1 Tax=Konateibacter massiliensis TaxID=2002841 RepID=UPI000C14641C|nr:galactoside O-acetyltransferase [Konateibacter massiliensis]
MNSFYTIDELNELGLKCIGRNVKISKKASIYGGADIEIGNNVRIDDFCILSGNIIIGNYIHVAAYTGLFGGDEEAGIEIKDFANISSKVVIYAISDDYSGETMTSPLIPEEYKKVQKKKVIIGENTIIGTGTSILPGVIVSDGCAIGAMSLVNKTTDAWKIYAGIPAKCLKERKRDLLEKKEEFIKCRKETE